jgi:hypothetical protein
MRVIGDFDTLSPVYASTHLPEDVTAWFREAGLIDVSAQDYLTSVCGRRAPVHKVGADRVGTQDVEIAGS